MDFEVVTPESVGISSDSILRNLVNINAQLCPMHSILIMRHGKLAFEAYWKPFDVDTKHRMYSITKSFVSLAIGVLEKEGRIRLDDRIIEYFPEYASECKSEKVKECTIRDLLKMTSCHRRTAYKEGSPNWNYVKSFQDDWAKAFFTVSADHDPGALFIYDTSGTQVLGTIVEKVSGKSILDLLRSTLLKDSGFSSDAYVVKEPSGYSAAGSGLLCTSRDLLIALKSVYDGANGYISKEYIDAATSLQVSNQIGSAGGLLDLSSGYGYQFWLNSHGYMMYGMGTQLALAIPDKDMLVIVTSNTKGVNGAEALIFNAIWDIVDSASDNALEENNDSYSKLIEFSKCLEVRRVYGALSSDIANDVNGKKYLFDSNLIGLEHLQLDLDEKNGDGILSFSASGEEFRYPFGLCNNERHRLPFMDYGDVLSSGAWLEDGTFGILIQYIDVELGMLIVQLSFSKEGVTVFMRQEGELSFKGFAGVASGYIS